MATRIGSSKDQQGRAVRRVPRSTILQRYYSSQPVPCPVRCGGVAEVVRVGTTASGGGELWVECTSCAQRARYEAPPATPPEKRRVSVALKAGREPVCPRHALPEPLRRRGRQLACPACGVVYRE